MSDSLEKSKTRTRLNSLEWLAFGTFQAGLVNVLLTKDTKSWGLFSVAAGALATVAYYAKRGRVFQLPSLLAPHGSVLVKAKYGPLFWLGIALMVGSLISLPHLRSAAAFCICSLCVLVLNRQRSN